jgi:dCTP deaminase
VAAIPAVQELVRTIIPASRAAKVPKDVKQMVDLLAQRIPPFQPPTRSLRQARNFDPWSFHEILTAGWLYQMAIGEELERSLSPERRFKEYQDTCLLLLKALELEGAQEAINSIAEQNGKKQTASKPETRSQADPPHGVVSGPSIRMALDRKDAVDRLVLCPDLGDSSIESASRDLHLGHWFRISRRTSLETIDIAYSVDRGKARRQGQSELFVPPGGTFVLQPGDFALATSLEYVYLPSDMMAFVEGKSSLGRAGLLIATATQVAPGFKGCIVLELFNAGTVPIILRPAMGVAQLVLVSTDMKVPKDWLYSGGFQVQIKP